MPLKIHLHSLLRRVLARRGYVLSQFEPTVPARLEPYLENLRRRHSFSRIVAFDSDRDTLNLFSQVFAGQNVEFDSQPIPTARAQPNVSVLRLLVQTDIAALCTGATARPLSELPHAAVAIVRAKIAPFWCGEADFFELVATLAHYGLELHDVLQEASGPALGIPGGNLYFAFERVKASPGPEGRTTRERQFRLSEAFTFLAAPIVPRSAATRITGRGSAGFAAGMFNPGAWLEDGKIKLLARAEHHAWPAQKRSREHYLSSCRPIMVTLGPELGIASTAEIRMVGEPDLAGSRFEDFRIFRHEGTLYSNHSAIQWAGPHAEGYRVRPERLTTSVRISRLDPSGATLSLLAPVQLDRPVDRVEKNWAMFSSGGQVHLIYSFNPFRRFVTTNLSEPRFSLADEKLLPLPGPRDGLIFRNSINPVRWDDAHFLHVVHKVFPEKRYVFWAVLLDSATLRPVRITRRPLLTDRSSGASITYLSSALCQDETLYLFGGLDDCAIGTWRLPKATLDSHWVDLT